MATRSSRGGDYQDTSGFSVSGAGNDTDLTELGKYNASTSFFVDDSRIQGYMNFLEGYNKLYLPRVNDCCDFVENALQSMGINAKVPDDPGSVARWAKNLSENVDTDCYNWCLNKSKDKCGNISDSAISDCSSMCKNITGD